MAEPFVMDTDLSAGSRLVWVLNRNDQPYTEDYKGDKITIPANSKKEVKMPFLEARQFLGQPKPLAKQDATGRWLIPPKALYTIDLSKEEKGGTINEVIEKSAAEAEKGAAFKCMVCNKTMTSDFALKVHISNMHGDATAAGGPA